MDDAADSTAFHTGEVQSPAPASSSLRKRQAEVQRRERSQAKQAPPEKGSTERPPTCRIHRLPAAPFTVQRAGKKAEVSERPATRRFVPRWASFKKGKQKLRIDGERTRYKRFCPLRLHRLHMPFKAGALEAGITPLLSPARREMVPLEIPSQLLSSSRRTSSWRLRSRQ